MSQQSEIMKPKVVERPKIEPLSVLPVFFNMKNQTVLLVGTGAAIAWKAELLLAANAKVILIALRPDKALKRFISESGSNINFAVRAWKETDFDGARMAIADFDDDDEAKQFAEIARTKNTPVNIVDRPDLCDFQFGSIVNRSPVVISISTSGAAPILAQAIRAKIETLLPRSLSVWAEKAKSMRAGLAVSVPDARARKKIWTRFASHALFAPVDKIETFIETFPNTKTCTEIGKVTLVGAGPGDADLLTIKAVRALQSADIILFDKLVSDEVLELARREAKRMLVGKRGGQASCRQDDINALMVKLAKQGKNVVRLKSGDPMIFGRAGEEISILENEGIEVETVSGVTSALAIASKLGISLTHRDCAQSIKFVTAHSREGELPDLDWKSCADETTTLMIYMGARTAPKLASALIEKGVDPAMPVLIAKGISRESEEITFRRLKDLTTLKINRTQPVMLGIGRVFSDRCLAFEGETIPQRLTSDLQHVTG